MDDDRERVDFLAVEKDVDLDDVGGPVFLELVVHRRVAARDALQLVEEVEDDLGQRHLVGEQHLAAVVGHVLLLAALQVGQRHHRTDVLLRHVELDRDDRLADLGDSAEVGHLRGVLDLDQVAAVELDLVDDRRRGRDQVLVELALEALLDDLHVEQPEEAAAEAKAERGRRLRLID